MSVCSYGQNQKAFTVKYFGLTVHPNGDAAANLQPFKLDKNARFVPNIGVFVGYEKYIYKDLISVKTIQGVMGDCSNGLAIVSHFGLRMTMLDLPKHRVNFGIGPTLIMRDSWSRFGAEYQSSGYFKEFYSPTLGDVQWKFIAYGLEVEYDYKLTEADDISLSCTPGVPLAVIFSLGWKHWLVKKNYGTHRIYVPKD